MDSHDKRPFFIVCGDPGGANALIPVIRMFLSKGKEDLRVFAYRQAINIMAKNGIDYTVLEETTTPSEVLEIFTKTPPCIVIVSTSSNSVDLEKKFIMTAKKTHVPCLAILDFWSNYSHRFSDNSGHLACVPDKIAVIDENACREMISEGFDPGVLVVTGQPAFDTLVSSKNNFSEEMRQKIRANYQIPRDGLFIVFVSQPLSQIYGDNDNNPHYPGYSERTVLKCLIQSLEEISGELHKDIALLIRPHPRERSNDYSGIFSRIIRIIVSNDDNPRDIVMASDLVTGMSTELLIEACYLGCIVVSIQPGLRIPDPLPTNKSGCSIPVYSEDILTETLKRALGNRGALTELKQQLATLKHNGHAADRVVQTIYQMIDNRR